MKVLLINGSPRENGNTFTALSEVANTLKSEGIDTEIISIGKQAVQGCIACGMCGRNGARCTFHDDLYYKVWRAVKDGIDGKTPTMSCPRLRRSALSASSRW